MIDLFEYNREAYEAAVVLLNERNKAAIVHPTGTGKSFIGFKLCEDMSDKNICWLSPSEYIYKTQLENLEKSGAQIPQNIKFYTYAKLMMLSDMELEAIQADGIILDEFHRCGAQMWGKGVDALLTLYKEAFILGLSATHIRYLDNRRNMVEELFDGNIASELTLGEAIVRGILPAPNYITTLYSYKEQLMKYEKRIQQSQSRCVRDQAEKQLEVLRRTLEKAEGLDVIFEKHIKKKDEKYIVFCANKEHLDSMIQKVPEWFAQIDSEPHVYSIYTDAPDKETAFAEFKADTSEHLKLLFCIDMLNEGVHVDGIAGVIMFRPTISPTIYKQQIGRALSTSSKQAPVIFDVVNNVESLYAIGTIEEEVSEAVKYLRENDYEEWIVAEKFTVLEEMHDCRKLFEGLNEILSTSWEMMYEAAKEYVIRHGDLNVPIHYKTREGYTLGCWISVQRRMWRTVSVSSAVSENVVDENSKHMGLEQDRIEKLDAIGMIWEMSTHLWNKGCEEARIYYEQHGSLKMKATHVTEDGYKLGAWLNTQRRRKREGKLSEQQITQLESCGMQWQSKYDTQWNMAYQEATAYYETNGNLDVPVEYVTDTGFKLGDWLANHRGKSEIKITEERKAMLELIGMVWSKRDSWDMKYELAKTFYEENGHLQVPAKYVVDGIWLNKWVNEQKQIYNGKRVGKVLTLEQREKLRGIGASWCEEVVFGEVVLIDVKPNETVEAYTKVNCGVANEGIEQCQENYSFEVGV